jgi:predicted RNase H-like HicB family nuclease
MIFHVSLEKAEDGWIVAECPALPGCVSQGRDEQGALANIREYQGSDHSVVMG